MDHFLKNPKSRCFSLGGHMENQDKTSPSGLSNINKLGSTFFAHSFQDTVLSNHLNSPFR